MKPIAFEVSSEKPEKTNVEYIKKSKTKPNDTTKVYLPPFSKLNLFKNL